MTDAPARFQVLHYSDDALEKALVENSKADTETVRKKLHLVYFREYLRSLGAKTIIVETDYVDRDYLEDFSSYYVKCFQNYGRHCCRLHFFTQEFDTDAFSAFLKNLASPLTDPSLQESYLGFIVLKPLPQTIIGRTCLKTYPANPGSRTYPVVRKYDANVYGCGLAVSSLAFQEQDSVVAACATSALWSAFHQTGHLFQHSVPTPVEITRSATEFEPTPTRSFPNVDGLTGTQMARAIKNVGLEPYLESSTDAYILRSTASAYLHAGIPVVLGLQLLDLSDPGKPTPRGRHAITLVGFGASNPKPEAAPGSKFLNSATLIDKFYAHDDQVGPFCRMPVTGNARINGKITCKLDTSWPGRNGVLGSVIGLPDFMLIPLYNKIRIPYRSIHDLLVLFDNQLRTIEAGLGGLGSDLTWDIRLTTNSGIKNEWRRSVLFPPDALLDLLTRSLPRFLWRACAQNDSGAQKIEVVFDATDIEQGCFVNMVNVFDEDLRDLLHAATQNTNIRKAIQEEGNGRGWQIFKQFVDY